MHPSPTGKPQPEFSVRFAADDDDLRAAQRLRYRVFVSEMGSDGPLVDHASGIEVDRFDAFGNHLLLLDNTRAKDDRVVGVYRLMTAEGAAAAGRFYSAKEYDLTPILASGRKVLELGRSCLDPEYRGGLGMVHLWNALADYVTREGVEILFGVASFPGTEIDRLKHALSHLNHAFLAPADLRATAIGANAQRMDLLPPDQIDRRLAMVSTPPLIKAYLKIGGYVGAGAWVDHDFNTTDVCLILDTARMNESQRQLYTKGTAR